MREYKVYYKGSVVGRTFAPSPKKAINNVRFKANLRFAKMDEFTAKEI